MSVSRREGSRVCDSDLRKVHSTPSDGSDLLTGDVASGEAGEAGEGVGQRQARARRKQEDRRGHTDASTERAVVGMEKGTSEDSY